MSKVVKGVGRAIGKVFKGVKKAVSKVWKAVKKSKILKTVAIAAAVYFGGAAIMGGISGAGGGGILSGMSTGISNAATSLSNAWGAITSGNISAAASHLGAGIQGTTTAATTAAAGGSVASTVSGFEAASAEAATSQGLLSGGQMAPTWGSNAVGSAGASGVSGAGSAATTMGNTITNAAGSSVGAGANVATNVATNAGGGASGGLLSWAEKNPMLASTATMMGGSMINGYYQQKQAKADEEDFLKRYNQNIGGYIPVPVYDPATGQYVVPNQANG